MVRDWTYMTLPWFVDTIRQEISNIDLVITTLFAVAWRLSLNVVCWKMQMNLKQCLRIGSWVMSTKYDFPDK